MTDEERDQLAFHNARLSSYNASRAVAGLLAVTELPPELPALVGLTRTKYIHCFGEFEIPPSTAKAIRALGEGSPRVIAYYKAIETLGEAEWMLGGGTEDTP